VVAGGDVASGATVRTEADGRKLLVHRNGDGFLVFDSHCPHQSTDIPLELDGNTLTCPKHHWEFDICTGKCIKVGKRPLKQFENKVENGRLLVYW
jgi:nitrite reductase/ring-hydroxylating ferredoxin subunit